MRWSETNRIPRLYAVLDGATCRQRGLDVLEVAASLRMAGVALLQYREKEQAKQLVLERAKGIAGVFRGSGAVLLLNDFPELVESAGFDGVHVGQGDMPVAQVRTMLGMSAVVGLSTHTVAEIRKASDEAVDYVAVGPVFGTRSKADAEPVVGLEGVRAAREGTSSPLVAIGGIGSATAQRVLDAGADSVAVIGALMDGDPGENARDLLRRVK